MKQTLIGQSGALLSVLDKVSKLAPIERPVLIMGDRGTGKELIAQRLHYLSKRWDKPLISLNCAALNEGIVDSELFGHESGSFSGATGKHIGRFERAEGGSLFLDELATTPTTVQEKLLRVIEYGEYERVGGRHSLQANVRLICATNVNLLELSQQGHFRADLLDRLAFDVIYLPSLQQRKEDILLLAEHFAMGMCQELGLPLFAGFSAKSKQALLDYAWPGNIRELKNVVERAIYLNDKPNNPITKLVFNPFISAETSAEQEAIEPESQHIEKPVVSLPIDYKQWQHDQDTALISNALNQAQYNQKKAASLLGLSYHQFRGMLRKYKMV
ncbi:phage shock protein operon transcriptional activator [Vibrio sp. UCD-FRSSP16_10]|uniref:phage shock protein operon transcriptional activator n=1 Tax=unclassified Vibrio TaxID=2614977 RepID=UPI0007FD740F|nr:MULTISPECIES: phage shock protein operon transcriptional activator [unclassified Vibrio]OBT13893.1 phage shock protein operon transcriptional activator [Vibrio sp. UCD-FRSSP16_30]OBT22774.1 phage shock protein operon transcriptional activator [Vibrio sp. UCD-FRSSP16_10]